MAPTERLSKSSVWGTQEAPRSWLSQIPPLAEPQSTWLESLGSTAMAATLPETFIRSKSAVCPLETVAGPSERHCGSPSDTGGICSAAPRYTRVAVSCLDATDSG